VYTEQRDLMATMWMASDMGSPDACPEEPMLVESWVDSEGAP
jgi:hypothetical protein